ncbi:uncharacterized protein LOC134661525 [Cydia amplana]|uniref:uncharacterized protein LOC134661525 n=1 Tax=Cydia amplana TaxID=1869771 RepID=UPI002FE50964
MEDNIVNHILCLHKQGKWKEICDSFHDHPDRSKVLWVFPSEENFAFIGDSVREMGCDRVLSVGCGSGLLEWMITRATGLPTSGIEVDGAWWRCKYAPPTFIPLLFTAPTLDKDIIRLLHSSTTALLFCYFNNRPAFEEYLRNFTGKVLIIIGPGDGKGVHTDPRPFGDVGEEWTLLKSQEVRSSFDFIAVYLRET